MLCLLFLTAESDTAGCIIMAKGCWVRIDARLPAQSNQPLHRTANASPPGCRSTTTTTTFAILRTLLPHPTSITYEITSVSLTDPESLAFPSTLAQLPQLIIASTSLIHYQSGVKLRRRLQRPSCRGRELRAATQQQLEPPHSAFLTSTLSRHSIPFIYTLRLSGASD